MPQETTRSDQRRDDELAGRFDHPSAFGLARRAFSKHAPLYVAGLFFVTMCIAMPDAATSFLGLARLAGSAVLLFCLLFGGRVLFGSLVRLIQALTRGPSYHRARDDDREVPDG